LPSHEDPYCLRANGIHWQSELRKTDLLSALRAFPSLHLPNATITVADRSASGRVHLLRFDQALLSATTFRFSVGRTLGWNLVRSDLYDLRDLGDRILLTGRGSGHGVGLCQNGAAQMAREGKSYREILAFYYPGTRFGVSAQEIPWQRLTTDNLILWTTDPTRDGAMLQRTSQLRANIEDDTGLHTGDTLQLRVYPDIATYRNATGEPGWIAAYTQRDTIHLQPLASLRDRGLLDSTLRHELLHHAVDTNTHARLPRWFQEGIVEYLANPAYSIPTPSHDVANLNAELVQRKDRSQVVPAYRESANQVAFLVARYGKPTVLGWLHSGIPADVLRR
jgi:stage II sporulation protein D